MPKLDLYDASVGCFAAALASCCTEDGYAVIRLGAAALLLTAYARRGSLGIRSFANLVAFMPISVAVESTFHSSCVPHVIAGMTIALGSIIGDGIMSAAGLQVAADNAADGQQAHAHP